MEKSDSLVIFSRAAVMLAEADTIQKAKELKSLALTAADWAKRKGMGEEAIQHCRSYALEAERKMGSMLIESAKNGARVVRGGDRKSKSPDVTLIPTLKEIGLSKRDSSDAQKLATLPVERFEALKAGTKTKKEAFNPTHVSHNAGENEWYTPPAYIAAAVEAMGGIDCDPASSKQANKTVKAGVFFDASADGLTKEWSGRVWLNPPYAQPLIAQFSSAVADKFNLGEIKQACVLVNNATETAWFQKMLVLCSSLCLPAGRVRFLDPAGNPGAPLQGQAVLYFGNRNTAFKKAFGGFGPVLRHD